MLAYCLSLNLAPLSTIFLASKVLFLGGGCSAQDLHSLLPGEFGAIPAGLNLSTFCSHLHKSSKETSMSFTQHFPLTTESSGFGKCMS